MTHKTCLKLLLAFWLFNLGLAIVFPLSVPGLIQLYDLIFGFIVFVRTFARCCDSGLHWQHLRQTTRHGTIWHKYPEIL